MTQEKLIRFFLNEKDYLKTLIDPLIETKNSLIKNESEVFHEIIEEQFKERMNQIIIQEFSKHFTITPEEAITMLEDISLEEFFKC